MLGIKRAMRYAFRKYKKYKGLYVDSAEVKSKVQRMLSENGSELDRLGFVHGTDKSSVRASSEGELSSTHDYLRHYDFLFHTFRGEKFSLVEFGCQKGNSLRMWEQYFPNAEIYGVDLDETTKQNEKGRVHIVIGDATSQETFDTLKVETGGAFIILDDASHAWGDQRRSFELFWDMLRPGGFYVVEDLMCGALGAYPAFPPSVLDSQSFFSYMKDRCEVLMWSPSKSYVYDESKEEDSPHFKQLPEHVQKIEREMDMCIFIPGTIIVRKKD